jgi:hypothetical protein
MLFAGIWSTELMEEVAYSCATSAPFYQTTQHNIPEDSYVHNIPEDSYVHSHHCVYLKSHLMWKYNQFILILVLKAEMLLLLVRWNLS